MSVTTAVAARPNDLRAAVYANPAGPEVFGAVVHGSQVWTPDPFDADIVHRDARDVFALLLARASAADPPAHGKSLLLLGEAGSGKTHLVRAFRAAAHDTNHAYCAYLQMTTAADDYARYVLSKVIDSLEHPYRPGRPETGLARLARGLLDAVDLATADDRDRLTDPSADADEVGRAVHRVADQATNYPQFQGVDIDLIRAMLFVLPPDPRIRARVMKWLRGEDLGRFDRELIGDLAPRPGPDMPLRTLAGLGRLMHAVHGGAAFVLLIDQIEQVFDLDRAGDAKGTALRQMVNTLVDFMDAVPTAVVVLACLDDLFRTARNVLPMAKLDRLERDPEPITLKSRLTPAEVTAVVGLRLAALFEDAEVAADPANPVAPYTGADMDKLAAFRQRDIFDNLRRHRLKCIEAGKWVDPSWSGGPPPPAPPVEDLASSWNDFGAEYKAPMLDDEPALAGLLAFAASAVSAERPAGYHFAADPPDGRFVQVDAHTPAGVSQLLLAVCDRSSRGGGLGNQLREVATRAGHIPAVIVRSTEFTGGPTTIVAQELARLVAPRGAGRRVVVADADWRALAAFRAFHAAHHARPGFAAWQQADKPVSGLPAVRAVFALTDLPPAVPPPAPGPPPAVAVKPVPPPPVGPAPVPEAGVVAGATNAVRLGVTRAAGPTTVDLDRDKLCRHAAFLGGSGSGKTTAALTVIERLLENGVPAILIDRKGDLARYADPAAWAGSDPDPDRAARRDRLRGRLDVALYTPGTAAGRPLAIPVAPDLAGVPAADRELLCQFAADNLGQMMGYRDKGTDPKPVILQKAIGLAAGAAAGPGGQPVTAAGLRQLVHDRDEALLHEVGGYDDKHYKKLAEDLLTFSTRSARLLSGGDPLDIDALLGRGPAAVPGKTRLSIISTTGLPDAKATDFWVAQFLTALDRWRAKSPSNVLQAVVFLDEADLYLPANGKPAAKAPLESLLRRGRSAGLGVFLATQSPGDLDYKGRDNILTWLVGRVKEPTAIAKLKPMLDRRPDAADKLAYQQAGEFYLVREDAVTPVRADRNLVRTEQVPDDRIVALARATAAG